MEEDYIVGFTLFGAKFNGFKTCHKHFSSLKTAKTFASNTNIKDCSKIYVNLEQYEKIKQELKKVKEELEELRLEKIDESEDYLYSYERDE